MANSFDLEHFRARLTARKVELAELVEVSEEARATVELDQSAVGRLSRMDALQGQAMAQETGRRRVQELMRIEMAFKRLDAGDFGYCVSCDEEIPIKRLELDPSIATCVGCAS